MKTPSGSHDRIGSIIRQAGTETPPRGMSERIMRRVEVAVLKKTAPALPVINRRGWILIGIGSASLACLCIHAIISTGGDETVWHDTGNTFLSLPHIGASLRFGFTVPEPLLFGLAGILLWFSLDYLFGTLKWKKDISGGKA